jgi:excisionase family DNA binding protein
MDKESKILQRLTNIEYSIQGQKSVLNVLEATQFLGIKRSYLYKLTSTGRIPFYKPLGKLIYFNREELEAWLQRNRRQSIEEIESQTATKSFLEK